MIYQDKKYGFSLEIPDDWKKQRRLIRFILTGGRISYESPGREANVNVSVGRSDSEEWIDRDTRRNAMADFLRTAPDFYEMSDYIEEVENFVLNGEENTVYYKHKGSAGCGRILSSVQDEIEYVIQSRDIKINLYETIIDEIINSFKFRT